jgi:hypothetical protein
LLRAAAGLVYSSLKCRFRLTITCTPTCATTHVGNPTDLAAHAVKVGLTEIGFSEHNPMVRDDWDGLALCTRLTSTTYVRQRAASPARLSRPDHQSSRSKWISSRASEEWIRGLMARHPWDLHHRSRSITFPIPGTWIIIHAFPNGKSATPFEVWTAYFNRADSGRESGLFANHRARRSCARNSAFIPRRLHPLCSPNSLSAAKKHDVAMELNTAWSAARIAKRFIPAALIVQMAWGSGRADHVRVPTAHAAR